MYSNYGFRSKTLQNIGWTWRLIYIYIDHKKYLVINQLANVGKLIKDLKMEKIKDGGGPIRWFCLATNILAITTAFEKDKVHAPMERNPTVYK